MKTLKIKQIIAVFVSLLTYSLLTTHCFCEMTGASFLKIGIGARAIGMGSAFTAISDDVTAIHWNPAGLSNLQQKEFSAMYSQWIIDSNLNFIGYAQPTKNGTFGTSIVYLSQGDLEGRDENRQATGSFGANDLAVTASYSRVINKLSSVGVNIKFIKQNIEVEQAVGFAFDVGVKRYFSRLPLSLGVSLQNIGPQMKFISQGYNLPLTLNYGFGYNLGRMTVALDIKQQIYYERRTITLGTEYRPFSILSLRGGYIGNLDSSDLQSGDNAALLGFGGGIGINLFSTNLDYAFVPYGALGNTHRLSFSAKF